MYFLVMFCTCFHVYVLLYRQTDTFPVQHRSSSYALENNNTNIYRYFTNSTLNTVVVLEEVRKTENMFSHIKSRIPQQSTGPDDLSIYHYHTKTQQCNEYHYNGLNWIHA